MASSANGSKNITLNLCLLPYGMLSVRVMAPFSPWHVMQMQNPVISGDLSTQTQREIFFLTQTLRGINSAVYQLLFIHILVLGLKSTPASCHSSQNTPTLDLEGGSCLLVHTNYRGQRGWEEQKLVLSAEAAGALM